MRALDIALRVLLVAAALGLALPACAGAAGDDTAPVQAKPRVILRGLDFGFDTAYIQPVSAGTLEVVAQGLKLRPDVRVRIEGHTDSVGSAPYNQGLSLERAEAVKRIMVGYGIDPRRLEAVGLDESQPIAPNDTEEGRAMNRRVELVLLEEPFEL